MQYLLSRQMMSHDESGLGSLHESDYTFEKCQQNLAPTSQDERNNLSSPVDVKPFDILCGRGKESFSHIGNETFRMVVAESAQDYMACNNVSERARIIELIIDRIHGIGGRFLRRHQVHGYWILMSRSRSQDKVGHAIRDAVKKLSSTKRSHRAKQSRKKVSSSALILSSIGANLTELTSSSPLNLSCVSDEASRLESDSGVNDNNDDLTSVQNGRNMQRTSCVNNLKNDCKTETKKCKVKKFCNFNGNSESLSNQEYATLFGCEFRPGSLREKAFDDDMYELQEANENVNELLESINMALDESSMHPLIALSTFSTDLPSGAPIYDDLSCQNKKANLNQFARIWDEPEEDFDSESNNSDISSTDEFLQLIEDTLGPLNISDLPDLSRR